MKPFLAGKKTLSTPPLRAPHIHKPAPASGIARPAAEAPTVEVVKHGDKVMRIVVTCTCGEKVEVDCLYPAGS